VELGLNIKVLPAHDRLIEQPPGSLCNYKVRLPSPAEVDDQFIGCIVQAYQSAG
jgi:hypothetical protein